MFSGAQNISGVAKVFFGMLAAALVLLVSTGRPTAAQPIETLNLSIGDAHIIETQFDLADIIVGDEEVARIALLSARSLAVTPLSAGATQVILRDESGALRRRVSIVVDENFAPLQRIINEIQPGSGVTVRSVNGRVVISGTVRDAAEAERVRGIAESYSEVTVVDALKIADPQQITLKVNILELSRSGGKELGINTFRDPQGTDGVNGTPFGVVTGNLDFAINNRSFSVDILLQALENKGLARRLANPTLVAVNGTTASFVVGGEVPVVTTDEDGTAITDYREYGVKLSFTFLLMDRSHRLPAGPLQRICSDLPPRNLKPPKGYGFRFRGGRSCATRHPRTRDFITDTTSCGPRNTGIKFCRAQCVNGSEKSLSRPARNSASIS